MRVRDFLADVDKYQEALAQWQKTPGSYQEAAERHQVAWQAQKAAHSKLRTYEDEALAVGVEVSRELRDNPPR